MCFIWSPVDVTRSRRVRREEDECHKTELYVVLERFCPSLQIFYLQCWLFISENNNSHDPTLRMTFDLIDRAYSGVAMMHHCRLASPDVSVAMVPSIKSLWDLISGI